MNTSPSEAAAAVQINPGETLRAAREAKDLSVTDAARALNMTESMLSNVESGAFDKLNGHTFARGYVRAYAKWLGLDQDQLVQAFDRYTGTDANGSQVRMLGRLEEPVRVSHRLLRYASLAVLFGGALLAYALWPDPAPEQSVAQLGIEQVEVEAADGTTQIHALDEPEDQAVIEAGKSPEGEGLAPAFAEPAADESPAADAGGQPSTTAAAAKPAPEVAASAEPTTVAPATAQSVPPKPVAEPVQTALPAGQARVQISFIADCWTQLADADGKVLFSALKRKGEQLALTGKAPLELRLGYARGAQVSVNGQSVDIAPFISGETARMKLGQ